MHVIVINRNQQKYVPAMIAALEPIVPLFVFDRCEPVKECNYIVNTEGDGFLAGKMRDLGAANVDDDILFIDGDKVPQGNIIADIDNLKSKYDCICYGIAPEYESPDLRAFMKEDNTDGIVPWQQENRPYSVGCYSCGMWLCRDAIRKLRELNGGRIFHPEFDGTWGDEDNFLADELGYSGFRIGYSTHVRLSGNFGPWGQGQWTKMDGFFNNFVKRIRLRTELLGAPA